MSSGFSQGMKILRGCRVLLAPSKSSATAPPATGAGAIPAKSKATAKLKPESKAKPSISGSSTAAPAKPKVKRESTRPSGILKVAQVSPALGNFMGASEASRTDAVKQIWSYIKLHNLQNPANKREIFCDEKLKTIFEGKETVGFLEIGKLLTRHFVKTD